MFCACGIGRRATVFKPSHPRLVQRLQRPCTLLMRRAFALALLAAAGISSFATRATAATTVAAVGDAAISRDDATGIWTLAAGNAALSLVIDSTRDFTVSSLQGPSGRLYSVGLPDSLLKVGTQTVAFG